MEQPFSPDGQDRCNRDMQFIDEALTKLQADRVRPAADLHVQSTGRLACTVESLASVSRRSHLAAARGSRFTLAYRPVRLSAGQGVMARSEQFAELLNRKTRIANDTARGTGIHRVVTRDGQDASVTGHDDVLALPRDHKARLLQLEHRIEMVDARNSRQGWTGTSISRTFSPRNCSSTTLEYSRMASLMFSTPPVPRHPAASSQ